MRKISIALILFVSIILFLKPIYATTLGDVWDTADSWLKSETDESIISETALKDTVGSLYNILLGIGAAVAIAVGFVLAIKFMAAGVEGKAEIKQALVVYAVGCVVVFGAFGIWKISVNLLNNVETTTQYCEYGKHAFDGLTDHTCNICGKECSHSHYTGIGGQYSSGVHCSDCGAEFSCGSSNHQFIDTLDGKQKWSVRSCAKCGFECDHTNNANWTFQERTVTCKCKCGLVTQCSKHSYRDYKGESRCVYCGVLQSEMCTRGYHDYNDQGICKKCGNNTAANCQHKDKWISTDPQTGVTYYECKDCRFQWKK